MSSGNVLSDGLLKQAIASIKHYLRTHRVIEQLVETATRKNGTRFRTYRIILDADLDASTPLDEPTGSTDSAVPNATVCDWSKVLNKYTQTDRRLAVSNHSDEDYSTDDACWAVPQDGHYIASGCPVAVSNRPTPPWEAA